LEKQIDVFMSSTDTLTNHNATVADFCRLTTIGKASNGRSSAKVDYACEVRRINTSDS
jgi:hypothetical protein